MTTQTTTTSARTLSASFSSSSSSRENAFQNRRASSSPSKKRCIARAEKDKFARDTIDLSKRKIGPGTAPPVKVTFLGANNSSVTVDCPTDQYILDAALDAGLELPFTCRGGICGCVFFFVYLSLCVFVSLSLSFCDRSDADATKIQLSFLPHNNKQRVRGEVRLGRYRPIGYHRPRVHLGRRRTKRRFDAVVHGVSSRRRRD